MALRQSAPLPGELSGCLVTQARMGPDLVIVIAPVGEHGLGLAQGAEQMLVQAFIPQPPVERFHKAILHNTSYAPLPEQRADFLILLEQDSRFTGEAGPFLAEKGE